jgi:hypothetical protein
VLGCDSSFFHFFLELTLQDSSYGRRHSVWVVREIPQWYCELRRISRVHYEERRAVTENFRVDR